MKKIFAASAFLFLMLSVQAQQDSPFYVDSLQLKWVDEQYDSMTLEEKVGQLFVVAAYSNRDAAHELEIEQLVKDKVRSLIFLGVDNAPLHRFFDDKVDQIVDVTSMEDAVKQAYHLAEEGDTVLLSPCCASFDLFENYEDRGRQFKTCVRNL